MLGDNGQWHPVVWHANTYRLALEILQSLRHVALGRQDKGVRAGRIALEQAISPILDSGVIRDFRQVTANQRQVVVLGHLANALDHTHAVGGVHGAAEGVTGICRVSDHPAFTQHLGNLANKPGLRRVGMDLQHLGHGPMIPMAGGQNSDDGPQIAEKLHLEARMPRGLPGS